MSVVVVDVVRIASSRPIYTISCALPSAQYTHHTKNFLFWNAHKNYVVCLYQFTVSSTIQLIIVAISTAPLPDENENGLHWNWLHITTEMYCVH